jgi:hypothetical protein
VPLRKPPHEDRVLPGLAAAQAMVQVADDELRPPTGNQEAQQGHGIAPPGNTHERGQVGAKSFVGVLEGLEGGGGTRLKGRRKPEGGGVGGRWTVGGGR